MKKIKLFYSFIAVLLIFSVTSSTAFAGSNLSFRTLLLKCNNSELKDVANVIGSSDSVDAITSQMTWLYGNAITAIWRWGKGSKVEYKDVLKAVAYKMGLNNIDNYSEEEIEKLVFNKYLDAIWDQLKPQQKEELKKKIIAEIEKNKGGIDENTKAAILASTSLSAIIITVGALGFTVYTTTAMVVAGIAGVLGLTLSFTIYTSISSLIATLTGPIGWALVAATFLWYALSTNYEKLTKLVIAVHILRLKYDN